ncbi:MAG: WD40 repeat domain-containing protein [Candidatus Babeliales bacterium]
MKKMQITFQTIKQNLLGILFIISCTTMPLHQVDGTITCFSNGKPVSHLKTTLQTGQQQVIVKTKILMPCLALAVHIEEGQEVIPLPNIPPFELLHVAACLQAHYELMHARSKEEYQGKRQQLDAQLNSEEKVHTALMAANYLDHKDLRARCASLWATKNYSRSFMQATPDEVEFEIAQRKLEQTSLHDDIAYWMAQKTWINPTRTLNHKNRSVWSLASNSSGTQVAVGDYLGKIRVYEQDQKEPSISIQAHATAITDIAFNEDDTLVATCARDGSLRFWDIETKAQKSQLDSDHPLAPYAFKTHYNTEQIAYDEGSNIIVVNPANDTEKVLEGHSDYICSLAFNSEGTMLASGGEDCSIKLWDLSTGACMATLISHTESVACVQFSPDDSLLAAGSMDASISLYDVSTQELVTKLEGHKNKVWSVIISNDNQFLYSASVDGSIKIWHLPTARLIKNLVTFPRTQLHAMVLQPNGRLVTAALNGDIQFWDIPTIIHPIQALQKYMQSDRSFDQAQLIVDAYDAPQKEPLDCSTKRERARAFETLRPEMQDLLIHNLHVKPPKKRVKSRKKGSQNSSSRKRATADAIEPFK